MNTDLQEKETASQTPIVSLVNLGCAKNTVDSERVLGRMAEAGFMIAENPADADICFVNTCGFIHDARKESAGVLRELQQLKKNSRLKTVVALGCLVERVAGAPETKGFLEAADVSIGFQDYPRLPQLVNEWMGRAESIKIEDRRYSGLADKTRSFTTNYNQFLAAPRLRIGSPHLAYLKISEGCSNFCKFCSIPYIRGVQVSRPIEDLVAEARSLMDLGAREIGLIAQDTTSYGRDLYGEYKLAELLRSLANIPDSTSVWFRLMYAFPRFLTEEMLDVLATDERYCPYIDMPLQHINDRMLSVMGRGMLKKETIALLDLIANKLPGGAIRTTFIVGYPGETEKQFNELLDFVREGRFTHVGAFLYSKEPKTPSAQLDDDVPLAEKKRRRDALMSAQRDVSRKRLSNFVGRDIEVMFDGPVGAGSPAPHGATAQGRSRLEAPEIDGCIFLRGKRLSQIEPGTRLQVRVVGSLDYDLLAEPV